MNKRPRRLEVTVGDSSGGGLRGQSDVIAIVLLLGMVFLGAAAVVVTGGFLVDSVQQDSEHQLAQDTAEQTHQRIFEAATSGEARQLPTSEGDAVQTRIVDSGSITLTMANASQTCSAHDPVTADLGAIEYDSGDRTVIYEGGAIWEHSEAGYSIRRAPGINYSDGRSQISLTVIEGSATNDDGERVVQPNETRSRQLNQELSDMILECRLSYHGPDDDHHYRDLNVSLDSQYADVWERYFRQSIAAGNGDATVARVSDDVVNLSIDDLSEPIDFEEWMVIHEWERHGDDPRVANGTEGLNVSARIRNTGPIATSGKVTLSIEGTSLSTSHTIDDLPRGELEWADLGFNTSQLQNSPDLESGEVYDYTVEVAPTGGANWTVGTGENTSVSHSFYFGEPNDFFLVESAEHQMNSDTIDIRGDIDNIGTESATQDVTLTLRHLETDLQINFSQSTSIETELGANSSTYVRWSLNRSNFAGGTYEYTISTDDDNGSGTFHIDGITGGGSQVTTGTYGLGTITVLGTEVSAESLLSVEVPPSERPDATVERVDRGMFMPTLVAEDVATHSDPYDWEIADRASGWMPAERVNGTLVETNASPTCGSQEPTDYETHTPETDEDWYGWEVDDCWNHPDGFVWSEDGGYALEWAIAGETSRGDHGSVVPRTETPWSLGGDGNMIYQKSWAPVSAAVAVEHDGDVETHSGWEPGDREEDANLNTYDTQEQEWVIEDVPLEYGSRVTVTSSLWGCDDYDYEGTRPGDRGYTWRDHNCDSTSYRSNEVDASGGGTEEGVRVLTDGDEVPVLRAGYPDQRSADEVLNDGAADRINSSTGELTLGPNEAVFLIELTDGDPDWDEAQTQDSYGDPNYNDVIVLFEYEAVVQTVEVIDSNTTNDGSNWIPGSDAESGDTSSETGGEGSNIETDVTHVVIG